MAIFFTSDLHFWHNNVITYCKRPYSSVEDMNEKLILNWNKVVGQNDVVYCLGDFSLAYRPVELFTKRLNGEKNLVAGNHDWVHPTHKKSRSAESRQKWVDKYLECGWDAVYLEHKLVLQNGVLVRMNHLPYHDPSIIDKRPHLNAHRSEDDGTPLLCGHVHEKWCTKLSPKGTPQINVGVDVWGYKPVSEDELCNLMTALSPE